MALAYQYTYPTRTTQERWADGLVHSLGTGWAVWLLAQSATWDETLRGLVLVMLFTLSAAYHLTPVEALREYLRRADHGMIFLTIAAVPTPYIVDTSTAQLLWGICITGAWFKAWVGRWPNWVSQAVYIATASVGALTIATQAGPGPVIWASAWFSLGLILFNLPRLPFHMPLWHLCVLGGLAAVTV